MKSLFTYLKKLVENAQVPLFTANKDDFYKLDKDVIHHDLQVGDIWYFGIKECGTYLTLADSQSEYMQTLLSPMYAPERRHFLIKITGEDSFDIKEHCFASLADAVRKINRNPNRVPARQFGSEILFGLEPMFRGSVLMSDFTMDKGAVLYLSLNNNSASYITKSGKARAIGLPFSFDRKTGAYKITITTEFGHGVCERIKMSVFTRAQKQYSLNKAA
ncbi:hypothetical protein [Rheinheimera sp.]|uniref:hypothetical protein n=1 Tax=Rheinheimera sp. TaxID=1869214 RepID=UPI00404800B1